MANDVAKMKTLLQDGVDLIPEDDNNRQYFVTNIKSIEAAAKILEEDTCLNKEEKEARLIDAVTKWVNQLSFLLDRKGYRTPEWEKEYRTLEGFEATAATAKVFYDARNTRIDEIQKEMGELNDTQNDIDIFLAVLGGHSKKEAKELVQQNEENARKAMQRGM